MPAAFWLLLHQFEEYAWPGGFPAVMNIAWRPGEGTPSDRYPLNRLSALVVNVIFAYPYYIIPIIFPNLIWMGLGQILFGMTQLAVHGVVINRKMHSIYNPGLLVVIFLHWPIGVYYIWYVISNHLVHWWMLPVAALWLAAGAVVGVAMPVTKWFADANSPYPFNEKEMSRFRVREKIMGLK